MGRIFFLFSCYFTNVGRLSVCFVAMEQWPPTSQPNNVNSIFFHMAFDHQSLFHLNISPLWAILLIWMNIFCKIRGFTQFSMYVLLAKQNLMLENEIQFWT